MTITVATTIPPFAMLSDRGYWASWLDNAEAVQASVDVPVQYFAAIEVDGRGLGPFEPLLERLAQVDGTYWTFSFDDGSTHVHTGNRLVRITTGQNLAAHHSMAAGAEWELFVAADTRFPDDTLPRLLAMQHPIVGLDVPTYCLGQGAPSVPAYPAEWDVRQQMQSAALILRHRSIFTRIKWRVDADRGFSDDPSMEADCRELLGIPTYARHDLPRPVHYPECIGPVETRHSRENMRLHVA